MKEAATIATHDFELAANGVNEIPGREGAAGALRLFQERHVLDAFLAQLGDPGEIFRIEQLAQLFELAYMSPEQARCKAVDTNRRLGLRLECAPRTGEFLSQV
jgi:hypothetical protein